MKANCGIQRCLEDVTERNPKVPSIFPATPGHIAAPKFSKAVQGNGGRDGVIHQELNVTRLLKLTIFTGCQKDVQPNWTYQGGAEEPYVKNISCRSDQCRRPQCLHCCRLGHTPHHRCYGMG